jgi:predicted DNA-binding transcriptional regulator AlpA
MTEPLPVPTRVLRPSETCRLVGLSSTQLWRLERAGDFPRRFKIAPHSGPYGAAGHDYAEVIAWLESRRRSRDQIAAPQEPSPAAA